MKIKNAAILYKGVIYEGTRHHLIGKKMLEDKVCNRPFPGGDAQGFITDENTFVDRETALKIAIESRQVEEGKTCHYKWLFSEDLF